MKGMRGFQKGHPNYNAGKKIVYSAESRLKMRLAKLGKPRAGNPENWKHSEETIRKMLEAKRVVTIETREKMRQKKLGHIPWWIKKGVPHPTKSEFVKNKIRAKHIGKRHSPLTEFKKGEHRSIGTEFRKGEAHQYFNNWSSMEPWGKEFTEELRERIRKKYNYRCQQCFREQEELRTKSNRRYKLAIHHIDYNKKNCEENNLIPLCRPCHAQTNYGREDWQKYFSDKVIP